MSHRQQCGDSQTVRGQEIGRSGLRGMGTYAIVSTIRIKLKKEHVEIKMSMIITKIINKIVIIVIANNMYWLIHRIELNNILTLYYLVLTKITYFHPRGIEEAQSLS